VNSVQRQQRAMEDVLKNGGLVMRSFEFDDFRGSAVRKIRIKDRIVAVLGRDLYRLLGFDLFFEEHFVFCLRNDDSINADIILLHCGSLPSVHRIDLEGTNVTDFGLIHLRGHRNLKKLDLADCKGITDASTPVLSKIASLQNLNLYGTKVTKASIPLISRMKNLSQIILPDIQISDDEKKMLREALPVTQTH
jgi:hypothetical protein